MVSERALFVVRCLPSDGSAAARGQQAEAACLRRSFGRQAKLDVAIAACLPVRQANLKELGYGG